MLLVVGALPMLSEMPIIVICVVMYGQHQGSTPLYSSAASAVFNRQAHDCLVRGGEALRADHRDLRGTPTDTPRD